MDEEGSVRAISIISVHEYLLGIYLRYYGGKKLKEKDDEVLNANWMKLKSSLVALRPYHI